MKRGFTLLPDIAGWRGDEDFTILILPDLKVSSASSVAVVIISTLGRYH